MCLILALATPSVHAAKHKTKNHKKTVTTKKTSHKHSKHSRAWKHKGQQAVDVRRTQQIQQALIQSHYLDGEPSGAWDTKTQEAMRRYQAANGWQSKVVPDSRALIKLGLGPSTDKLLNPESAMTSRVTEPAPATAPK